MPSLWEVVTGNSTLPVQAGTTFWDHLQNQAVGGDQLVISEGTYITELITVESISEIINDDEVTELTLSESVDIVTKNQTTETII